MKKKENKTNKKRRMEWMKEIIAYRILKTEKQ